MPDLLILLSPPRSFSSVVSTVIGQHPQLYGFPELHLFVGDTIEEVIRHHELKHRPQGPPGLLRTLAQLHDGVQTTATVLKARVWLDERRDWSSKKVFDYLLEKISPKIGLEKSPITSSTTQFLERTYACYPNAYYLHLTRHPISSRKSIIEYKENRLKRLGITQPPGRPDEVRFWYTSHLNIARFCESLPLGQTMRIKGEDVLSETDLYLPQIAEWMGLRTDAEAIEAMKHPENSPYACVGPPPAMGGNDVKFTHSPKLRPGKIKEPSLKHELEAGELKDKVDDKFAEKLVTFAQQLGYR